MTEKLIGYMGVDSGLCWVGDPCYVIHKDPNAKEEWERPHTSLGKDWGEFCDLTGDMSEYPWTKSFNYTMGHEGLGVCVSTAYGDGTYPVYAKYDKEGRIVGVRVDFGESD